MPRFDCGQSDGERAKLDIIRGTALTALGSWPAVIVAVGRRVRPKKRPAAIPRSVPRRRGTAELNDRPHLKNCFRLFETGERVSDLDRRNAQWRTRGKKIEA